jgi:lipopolysaccharide/colanic/teichoic acid biosynthesis glycosyltransferase
VVNELSAWLPRIADSIVARHASRLPQELSSRYAEEWTSELQQVPGGLAKLLFAIDLCRAVPRIQHEFFAPGRAYRPVARALARLLSVLMAMAALIGMAPLYAMLWCLVRAQGRPAIERQPRVGLGQKEFMRLRFAADARTPAGRWLLRTSLDQLPLLWNILRGDMNLVGPWPCRPGDVEAFGEGARFSVRPGLVGPGVLPEATESSLTRWRDAENIYVRHWTPARDLRILGHVLAATIRRFGTAHGTGGPKAGIN